MSDRQLGEGWWLASDGKWYPPQSRPGAPAPPPTNTPTSPEHDPYGQTSGIVLPRTYVSYGLTGTLAGIVIAAAALSGVAAILFVRAWLLAQDDASSFGEIVEVWDAALAVAGFYFMAFIVGAVLLLIWLNVAYKAAQSRGALERKWGSGWAVGAWFIPFANLVIPKLVVNEVDRMSAPDLIEPIGATWRTMPRLSYSDLWWALYIIGILATTFADPGLESSFDYFAVYAFGHACIAASGGFMAATVLTIGKRLREDLPSAFGAPIS